MKPTFRILTNILLWLFASLPLTSCVTEKDEPEWSLQPGDRCPQFTVTLSDGTTITTSDLAGHTTLLIFFDTTCPDCQALLPQVQQLYADPPATDHPLLFLAISRAQAAPDVLDYWHAHSLTIPVAPQPDRTVYNLFATTIIPRIYIIAPDLTITHTLTDNPIPTAATLRPLLNL